MQSDLKRLLIADDEEDILAIVEMCMELVPDIELAKASDGAEAIARMREFQPELVLLDVMMPEMDGPQTMKAMQADPNLRDIPVVLMTARVQSREVEEYKRMGAIGVIAKPFDPMTLSDDVKAYWSAYLNADSTQEPMKAKQFG